VLPALLPQVGVAQGQGGGNPGNLAHRVEVLEAQVAALQARDTLQDADTAALEVALADESAARMAADAELQGQLAPLAFVLAPFSRVEDDVFITGANLHLRNGMGMTDTENSLGNLILGYNENLFGFERTGSHNLAVGSLHGWTSHGGLVAGGPIASPPPSPR